MSCGSLDGTGVWGRMDTCVYMAESLCCSPETTTTLLVGYTPIQNKMFQFSRSVMSDSLWPHELQHARPPCLITNSWSLLKLMCIELVMPSSHLILCRPLLLLPSIFPSIKIFSNESVLCIRWPKDLSKKSGRLYCKGQAVSMQVIRRGCWSWAVACGGRRPLYLFLDFAMNLKLL